MDSREAVLHGLTAESPVGRIHLAHSERDSHCRIVELKLDLQELARDIKGASTMRPNSPHPVGASVRPDLREAMLMILMCQ